MIAFLARFSPGLRAVLALLHEVDDLLVAVEDVLHDQDSDPKIQAALNRMRDVRRQFYLIRGG